MCSISLGKKEFECAKRYYEQFPRKKVELCHHQTDPTKIATVHDVTDR
jgi:hypothetical protein